MNSIRIAINVIREIDNHDEDIFPQVFTRKYYLNSVDFCQCFNIITKNTMNFQSE